LLRDIRAFFAARGVLEVETPILSSHATTDPAIHSLRGSWGGQGFFLATSPEFPMKRLLAAGSGPIYQVSKVFRDGERGRLHHPEFTMLEWYRAGEPYGALMEDCAELLHTLLPELDLPGAVVLDYEQALLDACGMRLDAGPDQVLPALRALGWTSPIPEPAIWQDLLYGAMVVPGLGRDRPVFIANFPPDQAALAVIDPGPPPRAQRFELILRGMELANGFLELCDATEQRQRFIEDNIKRRAQGLEVLPMDEHLLEALDAGLPPCAGVALGLDRLLMVACNSPSIDDVLAFPIERA
jgi:lysyl-tRNA synthetase class 2